MLTILRWVVIVVLGVTPSILFYVWLAQNAQLPALWPQEISPLPMAAACAVNLTLFAMFACLHTLMAQWEFPRPLYMVITGATLLILMGLWQPLRIPIWALVAPPLGRPVNVAITLTMVSILVAIVSKHSALEFVGLHAATPQLKMTGVYDVVRHPMNVVILAVFWVAPVMNLDRLLLAASATIYLSLAVPMEERRLLRRYGSAYAEYQLRVPAMIPRWWR